MSGTPGPVLSSLERRRRAARRRQRRKLGATVVAVVIVAAAAGAIAARRSLWGSTPRGSPASAAAALAAALPDDRLSGLRFANVGARAAELSWTAIRKRMTDAQPSVDVIANSARGSEAVATLRWRWRLPGGRSWSYTAPLSLRYVDGAWEAVWSIHLVDRQLQPGEVLDLELITPRRGQLLTAEGQPILEPRSVINVGIEPERVRHLGTLLHDLNRILGVPIAPLEAAVRAAAPTAFVPVITLRIAAYQAVEAEIYPLPGTVFTAATESLGPTAGFAQAVLGVTGPATAAMARASGGTIVPGETVGLSGLQASFNATLAGLPGVTVRAQPSHGGGKRRVLTALPAQPGKPVRTTIQTAAEEDAEQALTGIPNPSALVALNVTTGAIIASAIGPEAGGYDIAMQGEYPPGSTFKIATTLALLERGEQTDDTVDCPSTITVDGRTFHNAEHEVLGEVSFAEDFANSCNTAFISLAPRLTGDALTAAARTLGIGRTYAAGVPVFSGSIPVPDSPLERAAEDFGQGYDLVSPLALASAAAAVARGRWIAPYLVASAAGDRPQGPQIPAQIDATLRELMRDVVLEGTGTLLADQPGLPVYAKTGTAETGTLVPPLTDAWFVGFQGNIAFAALVANTKNGFGGVVAAPLISHFLAELDG